MREFINIITELNSYKSSDEYQNFKNILGNDAEHPRKGQWKLIDKFVQSLVDKGYKKLGAGGFGAVLKHPNFDYAIKIFRKDPAYLEFVKFCLNNQSNPFLPKFKGKFMKLDDNNYVVRVELLSDLSKDEKHNVTWAAKTLEKYENDLPSLEEVIQEYPNNDMVKILTPLFIKTMYELISLAKNTGHGSDFHSENFMKRGDQIVITDPIWGDY